MLQQYKPSLLNRYSRTLYLSSAKISVSTSANDILSGFINREKLSLYLTESTSVHLIKYAISLPDTEPLEHP